MDYFVLACEILYIIFTFYYTIEEILEVSEPFGVRYLTFIIYLLKKTSFSHTD